MISALFAALVAAFPADVEPQHAKNAVFVGLLDTGLSAGGETIKLPAPTFRDDQGDADQKAALRAIAGSERAAHELRRDAVTAPFVLKTKDIKGDGVTIRVADLYFVVRASLDEIRPAEAAAKTSAKPVEAGNMRFESRILGPDVLGSRSVGPDEWYAHSVGRLLDRIAVEATDHAESSRSAGSVVVASRTDPAFDSDAKCPNRWSKLVADKAGPPQPYAGTASYAKMTALRGEPGFLVVEVHFAFAEPLAWFDGAPIIRSKLSLIAQDQVRALRREAAKSRKP